MQFQVCTSRLARTVPLFIVTLTSLLDRTSAGNLTYNCYPNATLRVENPADYTMVFANNSISVCSTTWSSDKSIVYINNCRMDDDILVYFSYLDPAFIKVIGGAVKDAYSINCAEIPSSGVNKTISHGINVTIDELETSTYRSFEAGLNITSGFYLDSSGQLPATEAMVGTPLFWIIIINLHDYHIRPDECWAYGGKAILDTVPSKKIYNGGCTTDQSIVSDFMTYSVRGHFYAKRAIVHTFRFYGSPYVTIWCRVRVCPYASHSSQLSFCDTYACTTDRKKRDHPTSPLWGVHEVSVRAKFLAVGGQYSSSTQMVAVVEWLLVQWIITVLFTY